jgi:molybdate transport system permease protein
MIRMAIPDPSFLFGLVCVVLAMPFAIPMGWFLARRDFAARMIVLGLLLVPVVLPPAVMGLLLRRLLGVDGWTGSVVFLAAFVVALPTCVLGAYLSFLAVDRRYEEVARTLGASTPEGLRRVGLPMALPGLLAAALVALARACSEVGATRAVDPMFEGAPWLSLILFLAALSVCGVLVRWQQRRLAS